MPGPDRVQMKASNIAETAERKSLHKSGDPFATCRTRALAREPDGRELRWLLRTRRERPRRCRAAEERDELAALHSITSSAIESRLSEILTSSALAVRRLITN
jgi:hypothetical protein